MPERITKLQRWLDLIAFLVGRRLPVAVEQIMEGVPAYAAKWQTEDATARATARRTFERDKDELRAAGIPLETVTYTVNYGRDEVEGYGLSRRDFYLPYLKLVSKTEAAGPQKPRTDRAADPAAPAADLAAGIPTLELDAGQAGLALNALREMMALPASPLSRDARSAFRKLAFDLDPELFAARPIFYVEHTRAREAGDVVRRLSDALLARKRVRFTYHGIYRGEATERDVAPYGLLFQHGHWYLVGDDALRNDIRVFRAERMQNLEPNTRAPHTPDYEIPADFRLSDYTRREAWELGLEEPVRALVLFRFPASLWAERNGKGELVETRADGAAVRAFDVRQVAPFLRWLLSHAGDADVLEPPELAAELRALARRVADAHAEA
ncbi:MAG: helix-turn-helix transcriptional regulator [Longimicrobiales bacterium]